MRVHEETGEIRRNYRKIEITINEMTAGNDGHVPMDLGNVGTHDARTTQSDSDTSNDMPYDDVCASAWIEHKAGKGAGKKGPNGAGTWYRGQRDDGGKKGGKKGSKGSKLDWYGDKDKGSNGNKGKGKGKSETLLCYDCGEHGSCFARGHNEVRDGGLALAHPGDSRAESGLTTSLRASP